MIRGFRFVGAGLAVCIAFALAAYAAEEKNIPLDQVPAAVKEAIKKTAGNAPVTKVSKETEEGKTIYEADFKVDGVEHSASFAEDGKLLEEEEEIKIADLPAPVAATVAKTAPNAPIKEAAKVKKDGKSFYEIDVKAADGIHEIRVAADGTLLGNKLEKDEK